MARNRLNQGVSCARTRNVEQRYEHEETGAQTLDRPFLPRGAAVPVPPAAALRGAGAPLSHVGRTAGAAAAAHKRPGSRGGARRSRRRRPGQEAQRARLASLSGGTGCLQGRHAAQRDADAGAVRQGQRHAPRRRQGLAARAGVQPGQAGCEHPRLHHELRTNAGAPDHLRGSGGGQCRADRPGPVWPDQRQDRRPGRLGQAHWRWPAIAGAAQPRHRDHRAGRPLRRRGSDYAGAGPAPGPGRGADHEPWQRGIPDAGHGHAGFGPVGRLQGPVARLGRRHVGRRRHPALWLQRGGRPRRHRVRRQPRRHHASRRGGGHPYRGQRRAGRRLGAGLPSRRDRCQYGDGCQLERRDGQRHRPAKRRLDPAGRGGQ